MQTGEARGRGGCIIGFLVVMAVFVIFWLVGSSAGLFGSRISIPDYRNGNAHSTSLTPDGNNLVNIFYDGGKREGSTVKAFITSDEPNTVIDFYRKQTTFTQRDPAMRITSQVGANVVVYYFEKSKQDGGFILLVGTTDDKLVQGQKAGETYIILAEGKA